MAPAGRDSGVKPRCAVERRCGTGPRHAGPPPRRRGGAQSGRATRLPMACRLPLHSRPNVPVRRTGPDDGAFGGTAPGVRRKLRRSRRPSVGSLDDLHGLHDKSSLRSWACLASLWELRSTSLLAAAFNRGLTLRWGYSPRREALWQHEAPPGLAALRGHAAPLRRTALHDLLLQNAAHLLHSGEQNPGDEA